MLADKECSCETVARSKFGLVKDEERLARVAVHPRHFDKKGDLKINLFPIGHLRESGLSVTRADVIDEAEMTQQANKQAFNAGDAVKGAVVFPASEMRSELKADKSREFCVFDDPVDDNEAHACVLATPAPDDTEFRRIRGQLIGRGATSISDIYVSGQPKSKLERIIDDLSALTVLEAVALAKRLEEK